MILGPYTNSRQSLFPEPKTLSAKLNPGASSASGSRLHSLATDTVTFRGKDSAVKRTEAIYKKFMDKSHSYFNEYWPLYLLGETLKEPEAVEEAKRMYRFTDAEATEFRDTINFTLSTLPKHEQLEKIDEKDGNRSEIFHAYIHNIHEKDQSYSPASLFNWLIKLKRTQTALYESDITNLPPLLREEVVGPPIKSKNELTESTQLEEMLNQLKTLGLTGNSTSSSSRNRKKSESSLAYEVPNEKISEREYSKLLTEAEQKIKTEVMRQDEATTELVEAFKGQYLDQSALQHTKNPSQPWVRAVLYGPSGVGKTTAVKLITKILKRPVLEKAMNQCVNEQAINEFKGAGSGLVGHMDGTSFPERLEKLIKENSRPPVIILDELEKANRKIFPMLMTLLDEGKIAKADGEIVDAKGVDILMTSNAGIDVMTAAFKSGKRGEELKNISEEAFKSSFPTEFRNRMSNMIFFRPIEQADCDKILNAKIDTLLKDLQDRRNLNLIFSEPVKEFLRKNTYTPDGGVRGIDNALQQMIKEPLINELDKNEHEGYHQKRAITINLEVDPKTQKIIFKLKK